MRKMTKFEKGVARAIEAKGVKVQVSMCESGTLILGTRHTWSASRKDIVKSEYVYVIIDASGYKYLDLMHTVNVEGIKVIDEDKLFPTWADVKAVIELL